MSRPELISDYAHSELNLGVERRRFIPEVFPKAVRREIAKRPVVTTTAVVLLAAAAAGVAAGLMMSANEKRRLNGGKTRRSLVDLLR